MTDAGPNAICRLDGCEKQRQARRTLCSMHHARLMRHGDVNTYLPHRNPCAIPECDRLADAHGWCGMHAYRMRTYGRPELPTTEERFWAKVDKSGDCWLWTGSTSSHGYGQIRISGRTVAAHRFSYALRHGPIPDDRVLDHLCHTPLCVQPDHLRAVTQGQNIQNHNGALRISKSGVRGVYLHGLTGRWHAQVGFTPSAGCKRIRISKLFDTLDEAERWVVAKRNELHTHNDRDRK